MASTITMLAWAGIEYFDSLPQHLVFRYMHILKHGTDYLIKCHPSPNIFYGQVFDFESDNSYWGRAEDMKVNRMSYKITKYAPGSDLAGEASSALSSAALFFQKVGIEGNEYLAELLFHAR